MHKIIKNLIWVGCASVFISPVYANNVDVSGTIPSTSSCKALKIDSNQLAVTVNMPVNKKQFPAITDTKGFSFLNAIDFNFEGLNACAYYASGMLIQINGLEEKLPLTWMSIVAPVDNRGRCQNDVKVYMRIGFNGECEATLQN